MKIDQKNLVICEFSYKCHDTNCSCNGLHFRKYHCLRKKCKRMSNAKCISFQKKGKK